MTYGSLSLDAASLYQCVMAVKSALKRRLARHGKRNLLRDNERDNRVPLEVTKRLDSVKTRCIGTEDLNRTSKLQHVPAC